MKHNQEDQIAFSISEISNIIDVVPTTIRNWEKEGLIQPKRLANGYRIYNFADVERLKKIKEFTTQKMGLAAIKHLLKLDEQQNPGPKDSPHISKKMLGEKWRETRLSKNLSIEDVARGTGVSSSYISKIENAQANVSYDVLQKIAGFYGENVLYYYVSQNKTPRLVRKNSGEKFTMDVPGVILETIATGNLSVVKYTIPANTGRHISQSHNGSELVYILSGTIDYTINDQDFYSLQEGDSLHFNSQIKHRWYNHSQVETTLLWMYIAENEISLDESFE